MAEVDWDHKTVVGKRAKAPTVTRSESEVNGTQYPTVLTHSADHLPQLYATATSLYYSIYTDYYHVTRLVVLVLLSQPTRRPLARTRRTQQQQVCLLPLLIDKHVSYHNY